ncbi:Mis6-domain-containing protein [Mucor mucedo]|uniref:Mis6-domain-containing protein n=1 Tax=Mucor mucedo TaxID=29922 RepID=UPI002220B55C|nr:Mis6-domain-containing protein [Mucor mucedo]KAI7869101.1 Mis6-domain-containing protein [Mucor mucedo]
MDLVEETTHEQEQHMDSIKEDELEQSMLELAGEEEEEGEEEEGEEEEGEEEEEASELEAESHHALFSEISEVRYSENEDPSVVEDSPEGLDRSIKSELRFLQSRLTRKNITNVTKKLLSLEPLISKYGLSRKLFRVWFQIIGLRNQSVFQAKKSLSVLLPRDEVSENLILPIFSRLGLKSANMALLNVFLKWIICVYDYLDSTETITKLYTVLFHYLPFRVIRDNLCHLLYYMTRKSHVTPYRIRTLNELIEQEKDNASLIGLLAVYRTFDHSVQVPVNVRLRSMFAFEHPDPSFRVKMRNIWAYWGDESHVGGIGKPSIRIRLENDNVKKKKKTTATEDFKIRPAKRLDVFEAFDRNKDMPYSKQLQMLLEDRQMQHLLVCTVDEGMLVRLGYWLGNELSVALRFNNSKDKGKSELKELLQKLLALTNFSKAQLPVIQSFLKIYLQSWNGVEFSDEIFGLIAFVKPNDYEELYHDILLPLYRKYSLMNVTWKTKLINCYTEWLKNWALLDWRGHKERPHVNGVDNITWLFDGLSIHVDYFETMQKIIEHVDKICVMGLLAENDHPLLQHATLSFFEMVAMIPQEHDIPEIIVPSVDLVVRCFFSFNAMATSRMCGIIFDYINAFYKNDQKEEDWVSRHSSEYLEQFNTYVTDICTALWRDKALAIEGNATAFGISQTNIQSYADICEERGEKFGSCFSIIQHAALAGFSKRFFKELEQTVNVEEKLQEVASSKSLADLAEQGGISIEYFEYRVEYLNYLRSKGLTGIRDLLYASMISLINLSQKREEDGELQ